MPDVSPAGGPLPLTGRRALVTGAGSGLGRAAAVALGHAGAHVVLVGRRLRALQETAGTMHAEGLTSSATPADVTAEEDLARLEREAGVIDVLVNDAGTSDRQPWLDVGAADWDRVMDLNVRAAFRLTQLFAPGMASRGWGRVINIASVYGSIAPHRALYPEAESFDLPAYGASKAALLGLTRHLAALLGPSGVTVNAISPGMFETERTATLIGEGTRTALTQRTPLRRLGRPEDVGAAVVFLASPGADFVTGHDLVVDGGFSIL